LGIDNSIIFTGIVIDYGKLIEACPDYLLFKGMESWVGFFKSIPDSLCFVFSDYKDGLDCIKYGKHHYSFNRGNRSDFQLINITKYIAFASLTPV
jgi:hypothetical protein